MSDGHQRHKIIIFTEHRDTLTYLVSEITNLLGKPGAVVSIHGGLSRTERLAVQDAFRQDPKVTVLVATDAAGEGLNLQRAHLMINYDLPWNPNRIEQRFGRIHRIGQTEPCHLWNMVAEDTREGDVYLRLLDKIEQMRKTYQGKVFNVIGEVFAEKSLADLLIEAVRYGNLPETKAKLHAVIDDGVAHGIPELLREQALHTQLLSLADVERIRRDMEEARVRRLQPHHIEGFFRGALTALNGRIAPRQRGRFEVTHVPQAVREGRSALPRYERVCFDRQFIEGQPRADLLGPGHPLLDAVVDAVTERYSAVLASGSILCDRRDDGESPRLLFSIKMEVVDGHQPPRPVLKRFGYVELYADGHRREGAVDAPYLDYDALDAAELDLVRQLLGQSWINASQDLALSWAAGEEFSRLVGDLWERISAEVGRTRRMVSRRLSQEINYQYALVAEAAGQVRAGKQARRRSPEAIERHIADLERRRAKRLAELDRNEQLQPLPPTVASLALVVPQGLLDRLSGLRDKPAEHYTKDTAEVEMRAVRAVVAAERALGREPEVQPHSNPGFDIRSWDPVAGHSVFIEVKGRAEGAQDFTVTRTEVVHGKNADHYRLALVEIGAATEDVRYVIAPFDGIDIAEDFGLHSVTLRWPTFWKVGGAPR
jgi:hypothetical protein